MGRVDDIVTFVAYGLPGERVHAEIFERKPRYQRGRAVGVLEAAPDRLTAPCPIFGTCGGCHWQHATYEAQLRFKTQVLRDQLQRTAKVDEPPVEAAIPSPLQWHYRNVVQMVPASAGDRSATLSDTVGRSNGATVRRLRNPAKPDSEVVGRSPDRLLCFQRAHSHEAVPVEHCYISDPLINEAINEAPWQALSDDTWRALHEVHLRVVPDHDLQVTFVGKRVLAAAELSRFAASARAVLPALRGVVGAVVHAPGTARERLQIDPLVWGNDTLTYTLAGNRLKVQAGGFFQVNLLAAEDLVRTAVDWLEPRPDDHAVDAYGGVGTFALALASKVASVLLIEASESAVTMATDNAVANGLTNLQARAGGVEQVLARLRPPVDLLLLDPPRRGCGRAVVDQIARLRPRRVVYVSCEPSTLARDLRDLGNAGYRLTRTRVVDMFPQTYHLETVSLLESV